MAKRNDRPLPSMMADLVKAGVTGALSATTDAAVREIMYTRGEIRAARSYVEEEKLGAWLVERERITEDDRALMLLAQGGGGDQPFGKLLVNKGYLTLEELDAELEQLALEIIRRAARALGSTLEFIDGGGEGQLDTLPNVVTTEVVLLAAREFQDVDAIRKVIGPSDQSVKISGSLNDMLEDVQLTPTEGFLLSRLDAAPDVAGLVRLSSLPEGQTYNTLYTLLLSGTVIVGDGSQTEPPAPLVQEAEPLEGQLAETIEKSGESEFDFTERQLEERRYILKLADEVTKIDHYRALDLTPEANPREIKESWEKIQNRFSAENPASHLRDMTAHLERIVERGRAAYEVLSTLRARTRYDEILKSLAQDRKPIEEAERAAVDAKARKALVEANIKRADQLIKEDEFYLAIQLLEQACALEPRPAELLKLARLLQRNPLWVNRALACMRRAIEADPKNVDAWLELAEFWRLRNHAERQRKSLERVLAIDADNEQANKMYKSLAGNRELQRLLRRARSMG
ncbi:MAG: tetratricopeptide repeat protein [Acidobacteriota bacterium]|jgi:curved DNA-binding protein CbpA|nr:tetratricopeptide repeat protein [Acidobacteriota bacterium]